MYMDYVVAIPSYQRADLCKEKTLKMLNKNNILPTNIIVFVANDDEYKNYEKILDKNSYGKLILGVEGLVNQRQFIVDYFPIDKHIISLDDDIESVDLSLTPYATLDLFFKSAFEKTKELGAYIWGVYPVFNPFFRKPREEISTCLNFIIGAFYGFINRPNNKNIILHTTNGNKEDVERSILYFIEDGIVVRFNKVGFITKYYGKSGGLGTFKNRLIPMANASAELKKIYPDYGTIFVRKNGMTEFRLKKIKSSK